MTDRVIPERNKEVDPLRDGEKATWAAYLPKALIEELKRNSKADGYKSASSYVEDLLVFALRARELERIRDRAEKSRK